MTIGRSNSGDAAAASETMPKSAYESPLNSPRHLLPGADPRLAQSIAVAPPSDPANLSVGAASLDGTTPSTPTAGTPTTATSTQDGSISSHPSSATTAQSEVLRASTASDMTLVDHQPRASTSTSRSTVIDPFTPMSPSKKGKESGNPLSSFKVTLEDPCYKVLPAGGWSPLCSVVECVLSEYAQRYASTRCARAARLLPCEIRLNDVQINDDWRLYALFLCTCGLAHQLVDSIDPACTGYGQNSTTERCLALDDRPLVHSCSFPPCRSCLTTTAQLLFQKLKESDMNPVFMLRHIKDIRSPMSIAAQKHATRRERRAKEERTITPGSNLADAADAMANAGGGEEVRPTRASEAASGAVPSPSGVQTFGVAVYPYFAERPVRHAVRNMLVLHIDRFTGRATCSATRCLRGAVQGALTLLLCVRRPLITRAQAKGWWRVKRHRTSTPRQPNPTSDNDPNADLTEGWVPSGCLVEVSSLPPESARPDDPKSIVHAPGSLLSQHVYGPALLDYKPVGDGELRLTKGEVLAIYKRYSSCVILFCCSLMLADDR